MAYPREMLAAHEELVLDLHPHWMYMFKQAAGLVGAIVLGIVAIAAGGDDPDGPGFIVSGFRWLTILLILVTLVWFVSRALKWVTTQLVLTTDRLIYRTGVFAKSGLEFPLERINTVFFGQSVVERILGAGDLKIESASNEGAATFESIKKPQAVQNEIYKQMEANEGRKFDRMSQAHAAMPQAAPAAPAGPSIPDQIAQLSQLRDQGVLTEAEFQAKKNDLLNRM